MPDTTSRLVHLEVDAQLEHTGGRTVRGLIVPFGVSTRDGRAIQYTAESLRWDADVTRIPLLFQHDHGTTAGHAIALERTPAGVVGTFAIEDSPAGDRVIREATSGSRTGFSVGVLTDLDSWLEWWNAEPGEVTTLRGELVETSHVSVPAFGDARIDNVDAGDPPAADPATSAALVGDASERSTTMPNGIAAAASTLVTADVSTTPPPAPAPVAAAPVPVAAPAASEQPVVAAAPLPVLAGATVNYEADVYRPGGEHSFVRDAFNARMNGDRDAADRLNKFNAQLVTSAAAVRAGFNEIIPPGYRGELLIPAIDAGRPIIGRLGSAKITLTDATPFTIPVEGEFEGVGDHVEGTAHVAAGTLTVDDVTVTPKAKSGAFEVSRELVDSSNPAIDRLAMNAMLRDYRRDTEAAAVTAYTTATTAITGGDGLENALIDFLDDRDHSETFIVAGVNAFKAIAGEKAGDGRARYPRLGATNANGTRDSRPGGLTLDVLGLEYARTGSVATAQATAIVPEDVLWGESSVLTFRFDEVQGPGVIKLALWAYVVAAKLRAAGTKTYAVTAAA